MKTKTQPFLLLLTLCAALAALTFRAGAAPPPREPPSPAAAAEAKAKQSALGLATYSERYRSGELDFSVSYGLDFHSFKDARPDGFTAVGLDYFVTRGLGLGLRAQIDDAHGGLIDRLGPRVTVRAPLWDRLAPYGYAEGGYDLNRDTWHVGTGGGVEWRFTKHLGAFAEAGVDLALAGEARLRTSVGGRLSF